MDTSIEFEEQSAKFPDRCELYNDMVAALKSVVEEERQLSHEEKEQLSIAFKAMVVSLRGSRRIIWFGKQSPESQKSFQVEWKLYQICIKVLDLVEKCLLPKAVRPEKKVLYMKIWADYCQYLTEIVEGDIRAKLVASSEANYKGALEIAIAHMAADNPLKVKLVFNFSLLYFDILDCPEKAIEVLKQAFDDVN